MFLAILEHPVIGELGVRQLAVNYRGVDEAGEYVFTLTESIDAVRTAIAAGGNLFDNARMQLVRVGEG